MLYYANTRPAFQKSKRLKLCAVAWLTVCSHHVVPGAVSASPPRRHIDLPFRQLTVTSASVICTLNRSPLEMVGVIIIFQEGSEVTQSKHVVLSACVFHSFPF